MNNLPLAKKVQIINLLVEGNSLRATTRIVGVSINTVTKLLVDVGAACEKYHFAKMVNIPAKRVQCDEIWSFVYAKKKNMPEDKEGGDVWTWVGIDWEISQHNYMRAYEDLIVSGTHFIECGDIINLGAVLTTIQTMCLPNLKQPQIDTIRISRKVELESLLQRIEDDDNLKVYIHQAGELRVTLGQISLLG
jgi:hypothetical protein